MEKANLRDLGSIKPLVRMVVAVIDSKVGFAHSRKLMLQLFPDQVVFFVLLL